MIKVRERKCSVCGRAYLGDVTCPKCEQCKRLKPTALQELLEARVATGVIAPVSANGYMANTFSLQGEDEQISAVEE